MAEALRYVPSQDEGSKAFNIEFEQNSTERELLDNIVSYLGEYRFNIPQYHYQFVFRDGHVRDTYRYESLKEKSERNLLKRRKFAEPVHRELAEDEGISSLDKQLIQAKSGDSLLWVSLPGPKDQGYGDYGFVYYGDIRRQIGFSDIAMTAIRIENPTLSQANRLLQTITGGKEEYKSAENLLAKPQIIAGGLSKEHLDDLIKNLFGSKDERKRREIFDRVVGQMQPLFKEFIQLTKKGSTEEKLEAFYGLENYALELKKRIEKEDWEKEEKIIFFSDRGVIPTLALIAKNYGYEPPQAAGSCGSTSSRNKNHPLSRYEILMKAIFGDNWEEGESCSCPDGNSDNHYHCPGCDKKYMDETNKSKRTKECSCGFEFGC